MNHRALVLIRNPNPQRITPNPHFSTLIRKTLYLTCILTPNSHPNSHPKLSPQIAFSFASSLESSFASSFSLPIPTTLPPTQITRVHQLHENIPVGRTYLFGFAEGGGMAFRLSCELSGRIFGFGVSAISWHSEQAGKRSTWRGADDDCAANVPIARRPIWSGSGI